MQKNALLQKPPALAKSLMDKSVSLVCKEPYRIFFPLGILAGAAGASHWVFYALGWIAHYSGQFHASVQMKCYMICFVVGFLLTAMPRFAQAPHATARELSGFLVVVLANMAALFLENWAASELSFITLLFLLAVFTWKRFSQKSSAAIPPIEFVWIPIAILHGLIGSLFLLCSHFKIGPNALAFTGKIFSEQGFLLSIVIGIGGFLGPRLMGQLSLIPPSEIRSLSLNADVRRKRMQLNFTWGLVLFASFLLEGFGFGRMGNVIRAVVVTYGLVTSRALPRLPIVRTLFAWTLWISMWMVLVGSWSTAFFPSIRVPMLHLIFIGGYALMTFAIGAMVVLSHGGEAHQLSRPLWIFQVVLAGVMLALGFRIASSFTPSYFFQMLALGAFFWLATAVCWLIFVFPFLFQGIKEGEFDRQHDEMKHKIMHQC